MNKIPFENGTLVTPAKLNDDNTITPAAYVGTTPLTAHNLNLLQDNVESEIINSGVVVNSTEPTEMDRKKVWLQKGKNLLDLSSFQTKTINGVTFTNNRNGTITINGTASASFGVNFIRFRLKAGTYHLSVNADVPNSFYIFDYNTNTNILDKETTATFAQDYDNVGLDCYIDNGQVFNNITISPQLEQGSIATTFEPYIDKKIYTINNNGVYEEFLNANETTYISNKNGNAIKFPDGTLIQYGNYDVPEIQASSGYNKTVTLPVNFIDTTYIPTVTKTSGGSAGFADVSDATARDSVSQISFFHWNKASGTAAGFIVGWTAIGRWK